ncbi:carbohydrate kinase family protein [Candidatus Thorarchaeota archaeon]|nr:MAG: carbohydrate kinase family protein [Candidatus Thorarchaeota archaeon]
MVGEFVSIGRINIDIDMRVDRLPKRNDHVMSEEGHVSLGGSAANFATQATRLGVKTTLFSCVGDDVYGEIVIKELTKVGVDTSSILVLDKQETGIFFYAHDPQDDHIVVAKPGANKFLEKRFFEEENIADAKVIHVAGAFPMMIDRASEMTTSYGMVLSLDPGRVSHNLDFKKILRNTDLLFLNSYELKEYFKLEPTESALRKFAKTFPGIVILKMGKDGAIATDGFEYCTSQVFEVPVKDSLGAGDSFAAGFITAWTRSERIPQALNIANAVAALTIRQEGAQKGQPNLEEVARLLRKHNIPIDSILNTFKQQSRGYRER